LENKVNIHANHRQRLKTRALREGLESFEPHNVLELMLFYVLPHVDTNDIAHELINHFGSFEAVFSAPIDELVKITGIKQHAATFLRLLPEFCRYYTKSAVIPQNKAPTLEEIKDIFVSYFIGKTEESVVCMFFDSKSCIIDTKTISKGSINGVSFSIRAVVAEAVVINAHSVAIAHNHPSDSPMPSAADLDTYKRMRSSLENMSINLIDSFIVCSNNCIGTREFMTKY